jgi:hypothetical protein
MGERAILAGKNKDVEERNNIIQSVTGKGHSNAWPGTASLLLKYDLHSVTRRKFVEKISSFPVPGNL